jgi:hypothetical protein
MEAIGATLLPDIKDLSTALIENSQLFADLGTVITNLVLIPFRWTVTQMLTMSSLLLRLTGQTAAANALWDEAKISIKEGWQGRVPPEDTSAADATSKATAEAKAIADAKKKAQDDADAEAKKKRDTLRVEQLKAYTQLEAKFVTDTISLQKDGAEKEKALLANKFDNLMAQYAGNRQALNLIAVQYKVESDALSAKIHSDELEKAKKVTEATEAALLYISEKKQEVVELSINQQENVYQRELDLLAVKQREEISMALQHAQDLAKIHEEFGLSAIDAWELAAKAKEHIDDKYNILRYNAKTAEDKRQKDENDKKIRDARNVAFNNTEVVLNSLSQVAAASKADAEVKRKIAQGLAIVNTAKAVTEYLAQPWLIPFIIASGMAQVAMIQNQKFAQGGYSRAGMAMVGERGPEMVQLPAGSKIYNNEDTKERMNQSTGSSMVFNITATSTAIVDEFRKMIRTGDANGFLSDIKSSSYFRG